MRNVLAAVVAVACIGCASLQSEDPRVAAHRRWDEEKRQRETAETERQQRQAQVARERAAWGTMTPRERCTTSCNQDAYMCHINTLATGNQQAIAALGPECDRNKYTCYTVCTQQWPTERTNPQ